MNWKPGDDSDSSDTSDNFFPVNEYYETVTAYLKTNPIQEFGNKNKGNITSTKDSSLKSQTVSEEVGDISSSTSSWKLKGGIPRTINVCNSKRNTDKRQK